MFFGCKRGLVLNRDWLSILLILCLFGCGVRPAEQPQSNSGTELRLNGTAISEEEPFNNQSVILLSNGEVSSTDSGGAFSFEAAPTSGDVWFEISGVWGSAQFALHDVPSDALQVNFMVEVDAASQSARVLFIDIERQVPSRRAPVDESSQITKQRCTSCHEFRPEPLCLDPEWVTLHSGIFVCSGPEEHPDEDPISGSSPNPSDNPDDSDLPDDEEDIPADQKPVSNPGTPNQCTKCHGDRGGPRCSDSNWRSIHSFYSCNDDSDKGKKKKKKKNKKHKLLSVETEELLRALSELS